MQPTLRKIDSAIRLIMNGNIRRENDGSYRYGSPSGALYTVTLEHCDCTDFELHGAFCQHQWACCGAMAVFLLDEISRAATITELERIGKDYAGDVKHLAAPFARIAEQEYKKRWQVFTAQGQTIIEPSKRVIEAFKIASPSSAYAGANA